MDEKDEQHFATLNAAQENLLKAATKARKLREQAERFSEWLEDASSEDLTRLIEAIPPTKQGMGILISLHKMLIASEPERYELAEQLVRRECPDLFWTIHKGGKKRD